MERIEDNNDLSEATFRLKSSIEDKEFSWSNESDILLILSLIDKYKTFVDAFPTLQHNLSQLADDKGNVQWSMISAMMDGYLEGFEQMKGTPYTPDNSPTTKKQKPT